MDAFSFFPIVTFFMLFGAFVIGSQLLKKTRKFDEKKLSLRRHRRSI